MTEQTRMALLVCNIMSGILRHGGKIYWSKETQLFSIPGMTSRRLRWILEDLGSAIGVSDLADQVDLNQLQTVGDLIKTTAIARFHHVAAAVSCN